MEHNEDQLEAFISKIMAEDQLEQPSKNFTDAVMHKVEQLSDSNAMVYRPLIPKFVWVLVFIGVIVLLGFSYLEAPSESSDWLKYIDLSKLTINPFENISFNFSKTLMYAMVLLAVMITIQIPLLKHYFNKRMSV